MKRVEYGDYNNLPHLITSVILEPENSSPWLTWVLKELERRYKNLMENNCESIEEFNKKYPSRKEPRILVVMDEVSDLMMWTPKEIETVIVKIAQLGYLTGVHVIINTSRPSTDVLTRIIRRSIPNRIGLKTSSGIDSQMIINQPGAETLLGFGDGLFGNSENKEFIRVQACYVPYKDVEKVSNHIKLKYSEKLISN